RDRAGGPLGRIDDADDARFEQRRIFLKTGAAYKVRLLRQIAQIVIKTAGAGVPPIDDLVKPLDAFGLRRLVSNLAELLFEPEPVVEREIYRVEACAAPDRHGL